MMTSRLGDDGSCSLAYGFDTIVRVAEQDYLTLKWAQSLEDELLHNDAFRFFDTGLFRAEWRRRGQQGLLYAAALTRSGIDYNPGLGFVTRTDFTNTFGRLGYGWFPSDASSVRRIEPRLFADLFLRNEDGTVESARVSNRWRIEMKSGDQYSFGPELQIEELTEPLSLRKDTEVPIGRHTFYPFSGSYQTRDGRLFRTYINARGGSFYDGWRANVTISPTWNVSRFLEIGGRYTFDHILFPDRNTGFDVHLLQFRVQMALNTKDSTNAFVQYNSAADLISANVRFRNNFAEGSDLWIVYDHNLNTDLRRESPALPVTDARTILLKYTYTFGQ